MSTTKFYLLAKCKGIDIDFFYFFGCMLNTRNRTLEKNFTRLKLTQIEYLLMKLFMENPGKAMSREDILSAVWGADFTGELKTVDVNIRRLRMKIEDDPTEPEYLTTVWGYGYKWGY